MTDSYEEDFESDESMKEETLDAIKSHTSVTKFVDSDLYSSKCSLIPSFIQSEYQSNKISSRLPQKDIIVRLPNKKSVIVLNSSANASSTSFQTDRTIPSPAKKMFSYAPVVKDMNEKMQRPRPPCCSQSGWQIKRIYINRHIRQEEEQ